MENIFEQATRNRIRFSFRGSVSVEDLWDLGVQDLDKIFKALNKSLKAADGESLLGIKNKADTELDLQIAIVRRIVEVKLAEMATREAERKILEIVSEKQDEVLKSLPIEDLTKMLNEL